MGFIIIAVLLFTWGYQAHNMYKYGCVSHIGSSGICGSDGKQVFIIMTVAVTAVLILNIREQIRKRRQARRKDAE
jgi:hypothetical protein